jgi:SulP family sulfate permease
VGIVTIMLILSLEKTRLKSLGLVAGIFLASMLPALFNWDSIAVVGDLADIPSTLPRPVLPPISVFPSLILPAISLALVALVQGSGVSKAYANPDGEFPDLDRDFFGQGISNIFSGIFQGIPVSGSFSATALSVDSGARTRLANITAGITMAVVLLLFGSAISSLALPALAGLLIVIGYRIIKPDDVRMVWRLGLYHETVMVVTFILTLLVPLQYAVFIGAALSILMYVTRQSNQVKIVEWVRQKPGELPIEQDAPLEVPSNKATVLIPYGSLFFAASQAFEESLPSITEKTNNAVVILSLRQRDDLGSTLFVSLERYADELREQNSRLILAEVTDKTMSQFDSTGHDNIFGRDYIFRSTDRPYESLREALHQAEKWINEQEQGSIEGKADPA